MSRKKAEHKGKAPAKTSRQASRPTSRPTSRQTSRQAPQETSARASGKASGKTSGKPFEKNGKVSGAGVPPRRGAGNPSRVRGSSARLEEPTAVSGGLFADIEDLRRKEGDIPETEQAPFTPVVRPEILAPAGDMNAALAAYAAGADAVYLGLKHFSARMLAENFSTRDLAKLSDLAHAEGRRVYVAMNTLVKPSEPPAALRLMRRLALDVKPDAIILQDPAMLTLARQAGFEGELHLSTLANVTHQKALLTAKELGASRVIVPRELSIDELRLMDAACPEGMELELFVHGALCYCVSGRCWWSSYMGGKSGLRGRCVQPCRRVYTQKGKLGRFFSCQDLSIDVLTKALLTLPRLTSWKIEGRRKGPHYVFHAVTAYRLLRDNPQDPAARKEAVNILAMSLGRPGTRALFLPQRDVAVISSDGQTSSGLLAGKLGKGTAGKYPLKPRLDLLPKDYLRVGYEDEPWHATISVPKWVPEGGTFTISMPRGKTPKPGTPVFLIDRKDPALMKTIGEWHVRLDARRPKIVSSEASVMSLKPVAPPVAAPVRRLEIMLRSSLPKGREGKSGIKPGTVQGLWLSPRSVDGISPTLFGRISWWLPPVIWPDEEAQWARMIRLALRNGGRHFVCNAPWQAAFFEDRKDLALTAGPFCNLANNQALNVAKSLGFGAAVISPELCGEDILALPGQSPLPLGIVLSGYWPVGISRHRMSAIKPQEPFASPKGESFWARYYGQNTWIYPSWPLDLTGEAAKLEKAGYSTFIHLMEHPPKSVGEPKRTSQFNWDIDVL